MDESVRVWGIGRLSVLTETKWAAYAKHDGSRADRLRAAKKIALAFAGLLSERGYEGEIVGVPKWYDAPSDPFIEPSIGWKVSVWVEAKS